jgi:hypothetical protein
MTSFFYRQNNLPYQEMVAALLHSSPPLKTPGESTGFASTSQKPWPEFIVNHIGKTIS